MGLASKIVHSLPRTDIEELTVVALRFDVISFDVFDTALKRKCGDPAAIFRIVEEKSKFPDFASKRKSAEKDARQRFKKKTTINNIYSFFPANNEVKSYLMSEELTVERENLVLNPEIFNLYTHLISANKKIIFLSDMYLSEYFIGRILNNSGYSNRLFLLVSCEIGEEKSNGNLFKIARSKITHRNLDHDSKFLHIGDSIRSDFIGPHLAGFSAHLIPRY
ncbi:MAG: hypothetical protein LKF99_05430 [Bifidobacterium sp.]|jgi:predicted HAD superfamily hydrolase|nr:hypothetical protein [Bifidobacterium sp.]